MNLAEMRRETAEIIQRREREGKTLTSIERQFLSDCHHTRVRGGQPGRDGKDLVLVERLTDLDNEKHRVPANAAESPLALMEAKKQIEYYQFVAGDRFRADYERAGIARLKSNYRVEFTAGGKIEDLAVAQADALERVGKALDFFGTGKSGRVSRIMIKAICGDGETIGALSRRQGWDRNYTGPRFREALETLAEFYGLA